ncbi:MAG: hypothetical protein NZO16_07065 [Deltaproteobacteria bacterium]|nr:hypothetical protein [Deltaproteobacteria bacterium]
MSSTTNILSTDRSGDIHWQRNPQSVISRAEFQKVFPSFEAGISTILFLWNYDWVFGQVSEELRKSRQTPIKVELSTDEIPYEFTVDTSKPINPSVVVHFQCDEENLIANAALEYSAPQRSYPSIYASFRVNLTPKGDVLDNLKKLAGSLRGNRQEESFDKNQPKMRWDISQVLSVNGQEFKSRARQNVTVENALRWLYLEDLVLKGTRIDMHLPRFLFSGLVMAVTQIAKRELSHIKADLNKVERSLELPERT